MSCGFRLVGASCIALLGAALLGGCLVPSPPRKAPRTPSVRLAIEGSASDRTVAPASASTPRRLEHDLVGLQALARTRNPSVSEWRARVLAAEARSRQARSLYFPHLRSDGRFLRLDEEVAFTDPIGNDIVFQDRDTYSQTTTLVYEAFDWGRRHFLHQSTLQEAEGETQRQRRAMQELDFRVATVYFALFEARRDLDVARSSVESLEGALKLARDLRAVDRANDADVLVVEANLERRRFQVRQLEVLSERLEEDIAHLLLLDLSTQLDLEEPILVLDAPEERGDPQAPVLDDPGAAWESLAFERRPELTALDAAHEAVRNARSAELATRLPKIGLFVQHEYSTTESAFSRDQIFSGGVAAQWELFSGLRRSARIEELDAKTLEIRAQQDGLARLVQADVRNSLRALSLAVDAVGVADKVVEHARENLERVRALFENGRATGQELLEAESLLRTEEARQNRSRYGVLRSRARLRFSCGLDFDEEGTP